ncbi:MAG: FkbM family methyltransferase [Bacteroidota bacterium]
MGLSIKKLKKKFPIGHFLFRKSYSQEGEDMIYRSFFERKHYKGFYVDVGAHHPYRFSNTLHFYKNGWRGINIEPTPGATRLFNIFRKRDINLNIGITAQAGTLPFYCFAEPALNSFSLEYSRSRSAATTQYPITKTIQVNTLPLSDVLDTYLPMGQVIDFLSIDAEGLDLEVLQSNNWNKYIPLFIMVEACLDIRTVTDAEIYQYMASLNYQLVAMTARTLFFKLNKHNS